MNTKKSSIIYRTASAGTIILIIFCSWAWIDFHKALIEPAVIGNAVLIEINKGDSFEQITTKLSSQNVKFRPIWLRVLAVQNKVTKKIKTGEFELTTGMTIPQILTHLVNGKRKQYALTIPEGWSFKEILQELDNSLNIVHSINQTNIDQVIQQITTDNKVTTKLTNLNIPADGLQKLEGLIYPDTYFFEKHTSDKDLLTRALDKMLSVLAEQWQNKTEGLPLTTPYEALILASIIEKETAQITERPLIAGVFSRRLKTGMRLQTDPTVIYGMGDKYAGNITHQDLITETPYNTYIIKGLPPTPIAMPGRAAIFAALHPDQSDNLYFVAKGDGSHEFSSNLTAHNIAVDNYQRKKDATR